MKNKKCINDKDELDRIARVVSEYTEISLERLQHKTRKEEVKDARQIAMHFMEKKTKASLLYIAQHFGRKDHSVTINARDRVQDLMDVDRKFKKMCLEIETLIDEAIERERTKYKYHFEFNNNLEIYQEQKNQL
ncbi:MAG TPA: helix-turn-helix domain-containing protein [Bacteroidia bacterium]|nr:helix-turn-helix domain-containing protein [Bacteroidia bacterium]